MAHDVKDLNQVTPDLFGDDTVATPFKIEEGVLPEGHSDEYRRGYMSAYKRASALTLQQRQTEKTRPGRTDFAVGWRGYFTDHC